MERFKLGDWVKLKLDSYTGCAIICYIQITSIQECHKNHGYNCSGINCKRCPAYFVNHYAAYKATKLTTKERSLVALYLLVHPEKELIFKADLKVYGY